MKDFKDKVAVITGGAGGIGMGLAQKCLAEGMKVVIADVEDAALQKAEKMLKKAGENVLFSKTDVSRLADVVTLSTRTLEKFGAVHVLFNNAGVNTAVNSRKPIWESTLHDWEWIMGVNLMGIVYGLKTFMPIMIRQNTECHIVNTASMSGIVAEPQQIIYAVTKAGVVSLTEGLYFQLKQANLPIGASVLCPAFVSSRMGEAERNRPARLKNLPENATNNKPLIPSAPPAAAQTNGNAEPPPPSITTRYQDRILKPDRCAELAFEGIRNNKFYIFTDTLVQELFSQRAGNIIKGGDPEKPKY